MRSTEPVKVWRILGALLLLGACGRTGGLTRTVDRDNGDAANTNADGSSAEDGNPDAATDGTAKIVELDSAPNTRADGSSAEDGNAGAVADGTAKIVGLDSTPAEVSLTDAADVNEAGKAGDTSWQPCSPGVFASEVEDFHFGTGQNHGQDTLFPQAVFGPPDNGNVQEVVSLGNGGYVTLGFGGFYIVDGPGPDFVVFENPVANFFELATVAVSNDLVNWTEFPCTAPEGASDFGSCAGAHYVYATRSNGIDPLDPAQAGGDWYDLADIGVASARYVRITDRVDLDGVDGVFDLDAVGVRNVGCP